MRKKLCKRAKWKKKRRANNTAANIHQINSVCFWLDEKPISWPQTHLIRAMGTKPQKNSLNFGHCTQNNVLQISLWPNNAKLNEAKKNDKEKISKKNGENNILNGKIDLLLSKNSWKNWGIYVLILDLSGCVYAQNGMNPKIKCKHSQNFVEKISHDRPQRIDNITLENWKSHTQSNDNNNKKKIGMKKQYTSTLCM